MAKEDLHNYVILDEDDFVIVSPEINPACQEELDFVHENNKILGELSQDLDLKTVAGFDKHGIQFMANACKISSISESTDLDKIKNQNFMTPEEFKEMGYAITHIEDPKMKTRCAIISRGDEVYVSFRGTSNMRNLITDLNATLSTSGFLKGRVHSGFHNAFKGLMPQISDSLEDIAQELGKEVKDLQYNFTGHSMGGAMAKIAAMYVHNEYGVSGSNLNVVTFGDPRVFDGKQAKAYEEVLGDTTLRIAQHHKDPVPAVSMGSLGYKHVGCQVRVEAQPGVTHKFSGYKFGIDKLDEKGIIENNSVSIFYHPSRLLRKLNESVVGKIQHAFKEIKKKAGHVSWAERERGRREKHKIEKGHEKGR